MPDLPAPRPQFELFVYSPRLEAVHLRFAAVARGGLRWSDRSEDFRTEILGLAKAQEVKNSVIVPSGAKGGFVCKRLPDAADREAHQAEVLACYRTFISAMLEVTDNLQAGQVVPPPGVVRYDTDDPYLVVAADKGTATFSDTANEIATSYGFWLGDAFASGGSEGYDHKKMGITARGAWESVKFHFATLGVDTQTTDFTVAGVGDMSGDVFGNGMLLSRHIKLIGAFDHRHVFLDPAPDPAVSFAERERLFALPRSSWADYDPTLISAGGGVWPRSAKSVPVSEPARQALGLAEDVRALSPDQLISAILAAPVDLLWNGGVGTYIKASTQSDADAGDRANDAVRIDATAVRAKVIAEGGNLGVTQAGRIEYALAGGLINTDFIDNSAGVDTSDHEVNIKILLAESVSRGELTMEQRNRLLQEMTDEVGQLVLQDNYHQNRALASSRAQAPEMLHVHSRMIRKMARDGRISRRLEVLPGDKEVAERRSAGLGLTTPEFAVLLAQVKIGAEQEMLASALPDDRYLRSVLTDYFPAPLREKFAAQMDAHPLRREIITTAVVNDMVDRSGTTFLFRMNEETGASVPDLTAAYLVARQVFDMAGFWAQVEALDGQVDVPTQLDMLLEGHKLTERGTRWLLHNRRPPFDIAETIDFFSGGVLSVTSGLPKLLTGRDRSEFGDAARLVHRPRRAPGAGRVGGRDGARLLRVRPGRDRRDGGPQRGGDRRGLLRPGRPAADRPAAGPDHRAAPGRPVEHDGPGRAARRPVRGARGDHPGRARSDRPGPPGGAAGRLGGAERDGGQPGRADADRDLGERPVHRGHAVGGGPGNPDTRDGQFASRTSWVSWRAIVLSNACARVGFPAWQVPIPQMNSRNCRRRLPVWSPSSTPRPCGVKQTICAPAPPTPGSGTTRRKPRRSRAGSPTWRGNSAGWTACGAASTTPG